MMAGMREELERVAAAVCDTVCHYRMTAVDQTTMDDMCIRCEVAHRMQRLMNAAEQKTPPAEQIRRFESFWRAYPRKEGKKKALQAWMKIAPDDQLTRRIISAVKDAKVSAQWREGFIPHAATYLNGERWNDEIMERPKSGGARGANREYEMHTIRDEDFEFLDLERGYDG